MAPSDYRVVLELHGSKAESGIELESLEGFIDHLRRALREYERWASAHEEEIGRSGQPKARTRRSTGFRLVYFKRGSGLATLEPTESAKEERQLVEEEPASLRNLRSLLEAIQEGRPLSPPVVQSLDGARKSLGSDGRFGAQLPSQHKVPFYIDAGAIQQLEEAVEPEPPTTDVTVFGKLHLLEFEEPMRVEVRAGNGINWACTYGPKLKPLVLSLAESNVRAYGAGRKTGPKSGVMELRDIEPLPEPEQTDLFTQNPISTADLRRGQGIVKPQGLAALQDRAWVDDEASREFVAIVNEL